MDSKSSSVTTGIIAVIIGVVIGGLVGYGAGNMKKDGARESDKPAHAHAIDTKASNLRVALNSLEAQHVDLAAAATRAGFDGNPSFEASGKALDENSVALSKAVGSVYGPEAEAKFLEIWRSHITFFVDYTVAAKSGDMAGMEKAKENLNGYVSAISDLLGGATGLPKEAVAALVTEHVGLLKEAVDKHGAGDYTGSYAAQQAARDQITTKIADSLADAIVKQNPDKFTD